MNQNQIRSPFTGTTQLMDRTTVSVLLKVKPSKYRMFCWLTQVQVFAKTSVSDPTSWTTQAVPMMPAQTMQTYNPNPAPMTLQSMVYGDENQIGKEQVHGGMPRVCATQQSFPHTQVPIIPGPAQLVPADPYDFGIKNNKRDIVFPQQVLQVRPAELPSPFNFRPELPTVWGRPTPTRCRHPSTRTGAAVRDAAGMPGPPEWRELPGAEDRAEAVTIAATGTRKSAYCAG